MRILVVLSMAPAAQFSRVSDSGARRSASSAALTAANSHSKRSSSPARLAVRRARAAASISLAAAESAAAPRLALLDFKVCASRTQASASPPSMARRRSASRFGVSARYTSISSTRKSAPYSSTHSLALLLISFSTARFSMTSISLIRAPIAEGQKYRKGAARPRRAFDFHPAAVRLGQLLDDIQAEAESFLALDDGHPFEFLEQAGNLFEIDAGAAVGDPHHGVTGAGRAAERDAAAVGGELEGVLQQIADDPLDRQCVAREAGAIAAVEGELDRALARLEFVAVRQLRQQRGQIDRRFVQRQLSRLDRRDVEIIVDQRLQHAPVIENPPVQAARQIRVRLGAFIEQERGAAEDQTHRVADVVRQHGGKLGALALHQPLGAQIAVHGDDRSRLIFLGAEKMALRLHRAAVGAQDRAFVIPGKALPGARLLLLARGARLLFAAQERGDGFAGEI